MYLKQKSFHRCYNIGDGLVNYDNIVSVLNVKSAHLYIIANTCKVLRDSLLVV